MAAGGGVKGSEGCMSGDHICDQRSGTGTGEGQCAEDTARSRLPGSAARQRRREWLLPTADMHSVAWLRQLRQGRPKVLGTSDHSCRVSSRSPVVVLVRQKAAQQPSGTQPDFARKSPVSWGSPASPYGPPSGNVRPLQLRPLPQLGIPPSILRNA